MKVFLGGTVNGSNWREYVIPRLNIDYFNPVVSVWNDEAYELELYEKRHANFCLYVVTPKLTGYFSIAEVVDDAFHKPDQTVFCYLKEDQNYIFNEFELNTLEDLGQAVLKNGGTWLRNLDEVIDFLNKSGDSVDYEESSSFAYMDCFISYGRTMSSDLSKDVVTFLNEGSFSYWIDDNQTALGPEKLEFINNKIRLSGNFIFIITPQSVKSEICVRELEFAVQHHKSIIVIHHIPPKGDWNKVRLILKDYKWYYFDENGMDMVLKNIEPELRDKNQHKMLYAELLYRSVNWHQNGMSDDDLLYGNDRIKFTNWHDHNPDECIILNNVQREYLQTSLNQHFFTRLINKSALKIEFITEHKNFERVVSIVALLNPLSFLPQLLSVINDAVNGKNSNGVSIIMFVIFFLINLSLLLVWTKQRNKSMVTSTILSMLLILSIVTIVLFQ